ncbi:MAG: hypothetical protein NXI28_05360 [bacterium]|nr:hypothetical protein [bacterium]
MTDSPNRYRSADATDLLRVDSKFWRFQILLAIAGGVSGSLYPLTYGVRLIYSVWSTDTNDATPALVGLVAMIVAPVCGLVFALATGLIGAMLDSLWFIVTGRYSLVSVTKDKL